MGHGFGHPLHHCAGGSGVDLGDLTSRQYQGAAWFALVIGFIAGLTFELVFHRLQKTEVVTTSSISAP